MKSNRFLPALMMLICAAIVVFLLIRDRPPARSPAVNNAEVLPEAPLPREIDLLSSPSLELAELESETVTFAHTLVVTDLYHLGRYGRLTLAPDQQAFNPTNYLDPNDTDPAGTSSQGKTNVAAVHDAEDRLEAQLVVLDDGNAKQNPRPLPYLASDPPTLRRGTMLPELTARVTRDDKKIRLVPAGPLEFDFRDRPPRPDLQDAQITVASFNLLNYWHTLDDGKNDARGADTPEEFQRQQAKLVAAIVAMDADIVGLQELENKPDTDQKLAQAINQHLGEDRYSTIALPGDFTKAPGSDNAIRVGFLYQPAKVQTSGPLRTLNHEAFANARTPLVQEFSDPATDTPFMVIVNHFKSKNSRDAKGEDRSQNDGQSSYNATRRREAAAVADYVAELEREDPETKILIIGDLNAYRQEDPIDLLRADGLIDLIEVHTSADTQPYSFVYHGQAGQLDYAFANENLVDNVTRAAIWHINADEPPYFDYNTEYKTDDRYQADPYRSSDHDPVLVGLQFKINHGEHGGHGE